MDHFWDKSFGIVVLDTAASEHPMEEVSEFRQESRNREGEIPVVKLMKGNETDPWGLGSGRICGRVGLLDSAA